MFRRPSSSSSTIRGWPPCSPVRATSSSSLSSDRRRRRRSRGTRRSAPCSAPRRCAAAGSRRAEGRAAAETGRCVVRAGHASARTTASSLPSVAASGSSSKSGRAADPLVQRHEVEVERIGVGMLVDQREGDVVGLIPGQWHVASVGLRRAVFREQPYTRSRSPATRRTSLKRDRAATGRDAGSSRSGDSRSGDSRSGDSRSGDSRARSSQGGWSRQRLPAHEHRVVDAATIDDVGRRLRDHAVKRLTQGRLERLVALGRPEHHDASGSQGAGDETQAAGLVEAGVVGA